MIREPVLVTFLVVALVLTMSLLGAVVTGFLRHLDGGSAPSCLGRAATAFGAGVTVCGVVIGLLLVG